MSVHIFYKIEYIGGDMRKIKKYILVIIIMLLTSVLALLAVSTLTYLLKWQADKAMIGIIVTYVLGGLVGGGCLRRTEKWALGKKIVNAIIISVLFMVLLGIISVMVAHNPFLISERFVLIWLLIASSVFAGMSVKR